MHRNKPTGVANDAVSLKRTLARTGQIKEVMDECVDELAQVNSVLERQLLSGARLSEVARALEASAAVEAKVQAAANQLSEIGRDLGDEVQLRSVLEQRLSSASSQEQSARHAATHDALTGLPNRVLFDDRVAHGLAQARRHARSLAVLFVDLDNFSTVNDTLGHDIGDRVLQAIALRLKDAIRVEDTVSRHGGDEFVIVLMEFAGDRAVASVAEKVASAIEAPFEFDKAASLGIPRIGASVGIAIFPRDGDDAEALLKSADAAMYRAKREGVRYAFAQ